MPCSSYGYEQAENTKMRAELDLVTRLLCEVCSRTPNISRECAEWYRAHQAKDVARLRKQALDKLTIAERIALGLEK